MAFDSFKYGTIRGAEISRALFLFPGLVHAIDKENYGHFTSNSTLLHYSARKNNEEAVAALLSRGAWIDAKDWNNDTPLHEAASEGSAGAAVLLIEKGADLKAENENGNTPFFSALLSGRGYANDTVLAFLSHGVSVNIRDKSGSTPLHVIAGKGDINQALLLISKGAEVNAKDKKGKTPLDYAEEHSQKKMEEFLRKRGAKSGRR